ncbi:MAG: hypothetical protein EBU90_19745 [Proteobacteria bacterium]|nr:hypothetical protein [Pseudomonadota bacterium]NBP15746.1 hypothetical protein [bacterium]
MARRVLHETDYIFTPSTRTLVIPRIVPRERLLLITNTNTNTVLYNFSDPTLNATSYTYTQNTGNVNARTTVVLAYNTSSMSATDKLQVVIDEINEYITPSEEQIDPVGKMRISAPQALIDTDFEYGTQSTKWESLSLLNNKPSFFTNTQDPIILSNLVATLNSLIITGNTTGQFPPPVGFPILINDPVWYGSQGNFVVTSNNTSANSFTFNARYVFKGSDGRIFNPILTTSYSGTFYSNANYNLSNIIANFSPNVITISTSDSHGMTLRNQVLITNAVGAANQANGVYTVARVLDRNRFEVVSFDLLSRAGINNATVYPKLDGGTAHRPFDGGVTFTTGNPAQNLQTIRQTRRYFRYQSGKGLQVSTGTILKPSFNVDDVRAAGNVLTVTTKIPHNLNPGANITISGAAETGYNGNYQVAEVIDPVIFKYVSNVAPTIPVANGTINVSVDNWYGAATRLGIFDDQNGLFFEYDGQQLYTVRRRATEQISGFVNVQLGNSIVTGAIVNGVSTRFAKQLEAGDFIVIRGQTYRVQAIEGDQQLRILPAYRGPTISQPSQCIVSKVTELKVPQSQWNLDKCDGTGPSGYRIDLSKMQMFYIDYSWYGAGSVRFGFRDTQGKVFYCHRFYNNNINNEAYMRSGNLPARYEVNTFPPKTALSANIGGTESNTISVVSTEGFPSSGILMIDNPLNAEYINYRGKTANTFTGLTRGRVGGSLSGNATLNSPNIITTANLNFYQEGAYIFGPEIPPGTFIHRLTENPATGNVITMSLAALGNTVANTYTIHPMGNTTANVHFYDPNVEIAVYLTAPAFAPTISHWGTSVIMDGRFDDDKSFVFTYGERTDTQIQVNNEVALFSIRVAPSVDNGITSTFGNKELINRMQLVLRQLDVMTNGQFLVSLRLNANIITYAGGSANTFAQTEIGTSSLSQICDHQGNVQTSGGETIYGFYAVNSSGSTNYETIQQDLNIVRDLGTSILGGGYTNIPGRIGTYPDGPDVVTVVARNIGRTAANIQARLCWTEAQA